METSSKINLIHQILGNSGLLKRPGSVLYSGDQTIKNGDWYFLGSNPGGHDDENGIDTIENQLLKTDKTKDFNEYFEGEWTNSDHQVNIQNFFLDLNLNLREILSTNLCFVRSPMESKYRSLSDQKTPRQQRNEDNEKCWMVHEYLLSEVKPKYIICNGTTSREFIIEREKYGRYGKVFKNKMEIHHSEEQKITPGGLMCTFHRGDLTLQDGLCLKDIGVFSVPHMGFYTYYPDSTEWMKKLLKFQFNCEL